MVKITLLGPPLILYAGKPVNINRKIPRALFYYLAAQGRAVSREQIGEVFWPGATRQHRARLLSDAITKLRKDLPDKSALWTEGGVMELNHEKTLVDWLELNQRLKAILADLALVSPGGALPASQYEQMKEMVETWGQRVFLDSDCVDASYIFQNWVKNIRSEFNNDLAEILLRLGQHESAQAAYDQAISWLLLAGSLKIMDVEINRCLIDACLQAYRYIDARAIFKKVKNLYKTSQIVLPQALAVLETRLHPAERSDLQLDWSLHPGIRVPFLGQHDAMHQLQTANSFGGGAVLMGESGSGKTRLVYEFSRHLGAEIRILVASCREMEQGMPFAPLIAMLRNSVTPEEWRRLDPAWVRPLAVLLPDLFQIFPDLSNLPDAYPEISRTVLLDAIHYLLQSLASKNKIILFVDDAHWADESTLAVISHLYKKRYFGGSQAFLILAARVEEQNEFLDRFLIATHPVPLVRIQIQQLQAHDISELANFMFKRPIPARLVDRLLQETGGNPLFLLMELQAIHDHDPKADLETLDMVPFSASVSDIVRQRLRPLSALAQSVFHMAAILGNPFSVELLQSAAGFSADEVERAIEELERAHLIHLAAEDALRYSFIHEKMREGLLLQISPIRKRSLHRKAALALEKSLIGDTGAQASRLAHHFEEALLFARAFHYWMAAGRYAWHLSSPHEAMTCYRQAERLIPRTSEISDDEIYQMYVTWNQVAFENDDYSTLEHLNTSLKSMGVERGKPLFLAAAYSGLSDAEMARNQFQTAVEYGQQALGYAREAQNSYEQARALLRIGVNIYMQGGMRQSQPFFQQALALTENSEDHLTRIERGNTFYQLGLVETLCGNPSPAMEYVQKCIETHEQTRNLYGQVAAYSLLALLNLSLFQYSTALNAALTGIAMAERVDGWRMHGYLSGYAGFCKVDTGQIGDAWAYAQKAIQIGQQRNHGEITSMGMCIIADIYAWLNVYDKAAEYYQRGMVLAGQQVIGLENTYRLGHVLYQLGQEIGAVYLNQVMQVSQSADLGCIFIRACVPELQILLNRNEMEAFQQRSTWFRNEVLQRGGQDIASYAIERILAGHAFRKNDFSTALQLAQKNLDWFAASGHVWYEIELLEIIVCSARQLGDQTLAHQAHRQLANVLDRVEASLGGAPFQQEWAKFKTKFIHLLSG